MNWLSVSSHNRRSHVSASLIISFNSTPCRKCAFAFFSSSPSRDRMHWTNKFSGVLSLPETQWSEITKKNCVRVEIYMNFWNFFHLKTSISGDIRDLMQSAHHRGKQSAEGSESSVNYQIFLSGKLFKTFRPNKLGFIFDEPFFMTQQLHLGDN